MPVGRLSKSSYSAAAMQRNPAKGSSLRSVQVPLPPVERFAEYLKSRGKRVTRQRRLIVQQVFSHHDHFDADELMAADAAA